MSGWTARSGYPVKSSPSGYYATPRSGYLWYLDWDIESWMCQCFSWPVSLLNFIVSHFWLARDILFYPPIIPQWASLAFTDCWMCSHHPGNHLWPSALLQLSPCCDITMWYYNITFLKYPYHFPEGKVHNIFLWPHSQFPYSYYHVLGIGSNTTIGPRGRTVSASPLAGRPKRRHPRWPVCAIYRVTWDCRAIWIFLVRHGPARSPCRPLFLSQGMPIPSDLSDFLLANSEMLMWLLGNLKIDSRESRVDSPLYKGDWKLRCSHGSVGCAGDFFVPGEIAFPHVEPLSPPGL
jgi:hypothetical protein